MPRFSLKAILATVTIAAIGCAALANPNDLWVSIVFSGTLALLGLSVVVAVMRRGGAIGFAICGWLYLGLMLWPGAESTIVPNLLTNRVLVEAESNRTPKLLDVIEVLRAVETLDGTNGEYGAAGFSSNYLGLWEISPFQRIGHSLFALLFAALGGVYFPGGSTQSNEPIAILSPLADCRSNGGGRRLRYVGQSYRPVGTSL